MPKFIHVGKLYLNLDHIVEVAEADDGSIVVRMSYYEPTEPATGPTRENKLGRAKAATRQAMFERAFTGAEAKAIIQALPQV